MKAIFLLNNLNVKKQIKEKSLLYFGETQKNVSTDLRSNSIVITKNI